MNTIATLLDEKARQRGVRRIPLYQAASEIGIHRVTLGVLMRQQVKQYDVETLVKLCNYFECDVGDLLKVVELREQVNKRKSDSEGDHAD